MCLRVVRPFGTWVQHTEALKAFNLKWNGTVTGDLGRNAHGASLSAVARGKNITNLYNGRVNQHQSRSLNLQLKIFGSQTKSYIWLVLNYTDSPLMQPISILTHSLLYIAHRCRGSSSCFVHSHIYLRRELQLRYFVCKNRALNGSLFRILLVNLKLNFTLLIQSKFDFMFYSPIKVLCQADK